MFFTRPGLEQATRPRWRRPARPRGWPPPGCAPSPTWAAASAPTRSPPPAPASGCTRWRPTRSPRRWPAPTPRPPGWPIWYRRVRRRHRGRRVPGRRGLLRPGPAQWPAPGGGSSTRPPTRRRGTSSPGWPRRVPRTVLKLAPGIDHALIPAGAEAEWVSVDGDLVEAALWCGPLAEVPRRASLLPRGRHQLTGTRRAGRRRWAAVAALRLRPGRRGGPRPPGGRVRRDRGRRAGRPDHRVRVRRPGGPDAVRPLFRGRGRAAVLAQAAARRCCASAASAGWRSSSAARRWSRGSCAATCGWPATPGERGADPGRRRPDRPAVHARPAR